MRKHRLGKQLLIVLCVTLLVFLAGCRPSPVLEQLIYEQNHEVDEDLEAIDNDPENEEQDENIPPRETVDDSEQIKDQEYTAALAGDTDTESEDPDAVYGVAYNQYGELSEPDEANPTEGSASQEVVGSGGTAADESGTASMEEGQEPGTKSASGEAKTDGGTGDAEDGQQSGTDEESGEGPRQMVDAAGNTVEIPQNVDTVTAVGEAATMVEMLGGSSRLAGTSSGNIENWSAWNTFDLEGVNVWWNGDGSSACDNMNALVSAHPDVCFAISGKGTFSEEQIAELNNAGIAYFVLPRLSSIANIKNAVSLVGEVLGDADAQNIASEYCSWADSVIGQAGGGSAKYTVYIAQWDQDAEWVISGTSGPRWWGTGAPVGMRYANTAPLNECMADANLTNRAQDGNYVEPLKANYYYPSVSGPLGTYNTATWNIFGQNYRLGNANGTFPAVVAADSSIANDIMSGDYFTYHWQVGYEVPTSETTAQFGFNVEGDGGQPLTTYIEGNYWIYVNPVGVGSWTDGSVESPLEAAWLSCKFQGGIKENEMQSMVSDFYNEFYHTSANLPNISEEYYITR